VDESPPKSSISKLIEEHPRMAWIYPIAVPESTHKKTAGRGLLFRCNGAPGEIRTPDRLVRSQVLYPAELRARI
jgi:hypothetical protein